jgi:hypothetical protein
MCLLFAGVCAAGLVLAVKKMRHAKIGIVASRDDSDTAGLLSNDRHGTDLTGVRVENGFNEVLPGERFAVSVSDRLSWL